MTSVVKRDSICNMAGRQSMEVTKALEWFKAQRKTYYLNTHYWVKEAAKKYGVHETSIWRALGRMNHRRETK